MVAVTHKLKITSWSVIISLLLCAVACHAQDTSDTSSDNEAVTTTSTSDGVCGNICFRMSKNGLFNCSQNCRYDADVKLPAGVEFLTLKMRENLFPPLVDNTKINFSGAGKNRKINYSISPSKENPFPPEELRIKFFYTFEKNGKWEGAAPELNEETGEWRGELEVPSAVSQIYHLTRVQDENDNSYIDIPCKTEKPALGSSDCFFPLATDDVMSDAVPGDKSSFQIDPSMDLTYSYFGYDDRRYYFRIQTEGKIDPGTTIPARYNYYMVGIFDPYRPAEVDPFHKTIFVIYAPSYFTGEFCPMNAYSSSGKGNALSENCIIQSCSLLVKLGRKWTFDTGSVFCETSGNEILISLQRQSLDPTSVNSLAAYGASGIILEDEAAIIVDYTPLNSINLNNNSPLKPE